jgi:hypothetical protein
MIRSPERHHPYPFVGHKGIAEDGAVPCERLEHISRQPRLE